MKEKFIGVFDQGKLPLKGGMMVVSYSFLLPQGSPLWLSY
jgi:hypothetical protein